MPNERRKIRQQEAQERKEKYGSMSLDAKIALAQKRGGSKKELVKLLKKKEQQKESS